MIWIIYYVSFCHTVGIDLTHVHTHMHIRKTGFVTPRDLLRWAQRRPDNKQAIAEEGYMLLAERLRREDEKEEVCACLCVSAAGKRLCDEGAESLQACILTFTDVPCKYTQIRRVLEAECGVTLNPPSLYALSSSNDTNDPAAIPLLLPYAKLSPHEPDASEGGMEEEEERAIAAREALGELAMTPSLARLVR